MTSDHRTARVLKSCCVDFNSIRSLSLTGWHPETPMLPSTCWSTTVMLGRGCAFHQIPSRSSAMSPNQVLARRITFTSASTLRLAGRPRAARRTSFTTLSVVYRAISLDSLHPWNPQNDLGAGELQNIQGKWRGSVCRGALAGAQYSQ
jgi:hypothetical protein